MNQETSLLDRITVRSDILGGKPIIRGMRFADWGSLAGIVAVLVFLWSLSGELRDLSDRVARLEGTVAVLVTLLASAAPGTEGDS